MSSVADNDARRKVRKGTHSCWECRRRKIRCQFARDEDTICVPCRTRGSSCRSQEHEDDGRGAAPERKVSMRLDRLETMMEQLMVHLLTNPADARSGGGRRPPSPSSSAGGQSGFGSRAPSDRSESCAGGFTKDYANPPTVAARNCPSELQKHGYATVDVFETSTADDTPVAALLGIQQALADVGGSSAKEPGSTTATTTSSNGSSPVSPTPVAQKYSFVSKTLWGLFPSQADMDAIAGGPAAHYVVSLFHSEHDLAAGRGEAPERLTEVPPADSHPTVLARRLLQLTLCMQQIAPCVSEAGGSAGTPGNSEDSALLRLSLSAPLADTVGRTANLVAHTVTASDELIGNVEGLQCLVLLGQQQANSGHLRKAWLSYRRALGMAQLMGLDRPGASAADSRTAPKVKSCDPHEDPRALPTPQALWYRIVACERYLSLMLGLRAGSIDRPGASFALETDSALEHLGKVHTQLIGRLIERNHAGTAADPLSYTVTQAIDADLHVAASIPGLDQAWWDVPAYTPEAPPACLFVQMTRSVLQVNHFCILLLLHLPYMLRGDNDTSPSRDACMRASRALLRRFIALRQLITSAFSCRHIDYAALIAAMTLIIGYLAPRPSGLPAAAAFDDQLRHDRAMVEHVRDRMQLVGSTNQDKLSLESAATIQKLLPLLDIVGRSAAVVPAPNQLQHQPSPQPHHPSTNTVRFSVPYFGTVNIHPGSAAPHATTPFDLPTSAVSSWPIEMHSNIIPTATPDSPDLSTMLVDFDTMTDGSTAAMDAFGTSAFPDLTGTSDDWAMQGIDTTYWSLLNGGGGAFGWGT